MARILLFEDDTTLRQLYAFYLQHQGHEVIQADCIDLDVFVSVNQIDLVLTDLIMPDRSGWEVICTLREADHPVGIIAMSGGIVGGDPSEGLDQADRMGADHILAKPFTLDQLDAAIKAVLNTQAKRRPQATTPLRNPLIQSP